MFEAALGATVGLALVVAATVVVGVILHYTKPFGPLILALVVAWLLFFGRHLSLQ